jgi:hypothetical protein
VSHFLAISVAGLFADVPVEMCLVAEFRVSRVFMCFHVFFVLYNTRKHSCKFPDANNVRSHIASRVAMLTAMYSASIVDRAIVCLSSM